MLKETILTVQTCDLKLDINCDACVKEFEKIMHKIDGVYQTNVNRQQGKVTLIGLLDMDTVFKKLKKAGMSAQLWDANSTEVNKHQKPQLGGSDNGDQLKDAGGKVLPQGEASNNGGCAAGSGGGTNDAAMVLPQLTPTPEQHLPNIQQQIEQMLQMLNGENLPPQPMGMPPSINRGGKHGKKICRDTRVLVSGNANNDDDKNDVGTKLYQDAGGSQVKNDAIGQPLHNGALSSLNNRSQAKKDTSVGVGSQMMGGSMAPQKGGMMRPANDMIGPTNFPNVGKMGGLSMGTYPYLDGYSMKPYGGGANVMPTSSLPGDGFYPSNVGRSGMEMMQQVAWNPMPQQPYMTVHPRQEREMMMNAHSPHNQNGHYGPGCTGYQLMGHDNRRGHLQQQCPPSMYYPMPLLLQHDNIFNEENPNICSLM